MNRKPLAVGGHMRRFNLTFRFKILLSLVVTVILFLGVLFIVIRNETSRQIRWMTEQVKERSNQAFNDLERLYHGELLQFAQRISHQNRVAAALQEAVEEEDSQVLTDAARYELTLAQIPLAIFTDETGRPLLTLLDSQVLEDRDNSRPQPQIRELLRGQASTLSGYYLVNNRLFTTQGIALQLFGSPVGTITIGFPLDDALAQRIGNVIQAEVGFWMKGMLLASTRIERVPGLKDRMAAALKANQPVRVSLKDSPWILISEPLSAGVPDAPGQGRRVIAISLEESLAPLFHIEAVFRLAGFIILLIALLLGISISRGLAAPVRQLVNATQRVARGDYNFQVTVKSKDELSSLADSFNKMNHGLLLKEQYRGILDKVVSPEVAEEMVKGKITLGGETREITTLFADVRGFTSMTEGMEPQKVIAMLNEFMEIAANAIDSEGGVVDKYVGDQVMAIYGAPVSHPDDPLRAVRSAAKMIEDIHHLNRRRKDRNEPAIDIGIGINTGPAVAGNMGSVNRLNYTVLGESVNVAARLCSRAGPAEILISQQTYERVPAQVETQDLEALPMKGLSKPVQVFKVKRVNPFTHHHDSLPVPAEKTAPRANRLMVYLFLLFLGFAGPGQADGEPPGLHYISKTGILQLDVGGRLELSAYLPQDSAPWLIEETAPFISGRLSLFTDMFVGKRLYGLVELRGDRGEIPGSGPVKARIQQAFLRYTLLSARSLHFQVGKFVSPFGEYSQRHNTAADPFIRPPLSHEYRTMICPGLAPQSNDGFIDWKYDPDRFRPIGAPVIWGVPYQFGAMIFGGFGPLTFRAAAMNSAPSSDPAQWDPDFNQGWNYSVVAHADYQFCPELKIGVSFNHGPYSLPAIAAGLPPGHSINEYKQILWGLDATYTKEKAALRLEIFHDTWEVPRVIDYPVDISYYLELKYKFFPGFFGALRYSALYFNKISYTDGEKETWDFNVQRWQLAVGYSFSPRFEVRAEYMLNHTAGPTDPEDNLLALQWVWRF
jgi:class 3 adenylate cyclase